MPHVALLTLAQPANFAIDDALAIREFHRRGWDAMEVPWTSDNVDWSRFDAVIVRTTWDYHQQPERFLTSLQSIATQAPRFANDVTLIRWNMDKRYLRDLAGRGVPIIPSVWGEAGDSAPFASLFEQLETDEVVVKPTIGANALDTFRLRAPLLPSTAEQLARTYATRAWLAQPFLHRILTEGEYSVFYFHGRYSHCIRKLPAEGDFRVQEEHGGRIEGVAAPIDVLAVADGVMRAIAPPPLQARVDLVRLPEGSLALMELEVIEPSLYLRTHPDASAHFVDAVDAWVRATAS